MATRKADDNVDSFDVPAEAPPAYEDVNSNSSRPNPSTIEKPPLGSSSPANHANRSSFGGLQFAPSSPGAGPSRQIARVLPGTITPKVQNDIRETIRGLVLNVLRDVSSGKMDAIEVKGVLDSCASACMSKSLSFASILQERSIEGRSAVYWSIASMSNGGPQSSDGTRPSEFLLEFLSRAAPLSPEGVSELRAACLAVSDNSLFQCLCSVPGLVPLSGPDRMLLAGVHSRTSADGSHPGLEENTNRPRAKSSAQAFGDSARVYEGGLGTESDSFKVDLDIKMFQRRMRVTRLVSVEFIARGRIWLFVVFVVPNLSVQPSPSINAAGNRTSSDSSPNAVPEAVLEAARSRKLTPGSWGVSLALLEDSMQCYARARLTVASQSCPPDLLSSNVDNETNSKPPIVLNLTSSGSSPLISIHPSSDGDAPASTQTERIRRESARARRRRMIGEVMVDPQERARRLDKVLFSGIDATSSGAHGRELMYEGCPYISPDGSLRAVLEVQLTTSPPTQPLDCVIC